MKEVLSRPLPEWMWFVFAAALIAGYALGASYLLALAVLVVVAEASKVLGYRQSKSDILDGEIVEVGGETYYRQDVVSAIIRHHSALERTIDQMMRTNNDGN